MIVDWVDLESRAPDAIEIAAGKSAQKTHMWGSFLGQNYLWSDRAGAGVRQDHLIGASRWTQIYGDGCKSAAGYVGTMIEHLES